MWLQCGHDFSVMESQPAWTCPSHPFRFNVAMTFQSWKEAMIRDGATFQGRASMWP